MLKAVKRAHFIKEKPATPKFKLTFIVLSVATIVWRIAFYYVLQEYGTPYVLTVDLSLFLAWWVFTWQFLSNLKLSKLKKTGREISELFMTLRISVRRMTYTSVLGYFKTVNRRAKRKLSILWMKYETLGHVGLLIKVFKWLVLPASLLYVCADFYFFRQNTLDSMFLGILIFVYSNFLPDLPSIYRKKIYSETRDKTKDLTWYKKYALLLFAPLFIVVLFLGMRLKWKTTETFHNFKSLMIYGAFLFTLSLLTFGHLPISIGDITEIRSVPFYALLGYLTHLKVDKVW